MIERLAKETQFKTFGDVLVPPKDITKFKLFLVPPIEQQKKGEIKSGSPFRTGLIQEITRKYKAFPAFVRVFGGFWSKYNKNQIAKCIKDHYEYFFTNWFYKMLSFDPKRLNVLEPNTRSDVDFNAKFHYLFTKNEVQFIEDMLKKYNIQSVKPLVVMTQLILTGLRLLGPLIQKYFTRPYDFQPENVIDEDVPEGKMIKIFFSSREA